MLSFYRGDIFKYVCKTTFEISPFSKEHCWIKTVDSSKHLDVLRITSAITTATEVVATAEVVVATITLEVIATTTEAVATATTTEASHNKLGQQNRFQVKIRELYRLDQRFYFYSVIDKHISR